MGKLICQIEADGGVFTCLRGCIITLVDFFPPRVALRQMARLADDGGGRFKE